MIQNIDQNKIGIVERENIFKNRSLSIPACQRHHNKVLTSAQSNQSQVDSKSGPKPWQRSSRPRSPPWRTPSPALAGSPYDKPSPRIPLLLLESGCSALRAPGRSLRWHSCGLCSSAECSLSGTARRWCRRGCAGRWWWASCSNGPWRGPRWWCRPGSGTRWRR